MLPKNIFGYSHFIHYFKKPFVYNSLYSERGGVEIKQLKTEPDSAFKIL